MKVGVFIGNAQPEVGGGHTFVQEVLAAIEARATDSRHRFAILTTAVADGGAPAGPLEVLSLQAGLPDLTARIRRKVIRSVDRLLRRPETVSFAAAEAGERLMTQAGIDVIWYLQPASWWTVDIPYITAVWDLQHRLQPYFPEVSVGNEYFLRDDVYGPLLRRASLVIAGTEVGSQEIQRFYGVAPERIRILPHPTPAFALHAATQPRGPRPAAAPADPYLLYPAQFWPHKNHVNLLEALRLLRVRDGLPFSVVLSGADKGNLAHVKATAARLGLDDAVHTPGFVARPDLVGLYQHAFALCYVTFFGPENLPPLEAFALGCPVLASNVSGAREQLGEAALLVDPRRPEEMADAVRRLHGDPTLRATLVERGRARARRFTGREFVSGVLAWLDEFEPVRRCWPSGAS